MKKKLIGLMILAVMVVFACVGCAGGPSASNPSNDEQSYSEPGTNSGVSSAVQFEQRGGTGQRSKKMDVTITIDGEDYAFPMPYEEFVAKGWALYDPKLYPLEDWNDGLDPDYHGANVFFSKGDIKALRVYTANPTDSVMKFSQCGVIGFQVDYDNMIDMMDAREVVSIPAGSIQINGLGIGEATQKEFSEKFGDPTFKDPTDGYRNGNETYDPPDNETLIVRYDENAVMSSFLYRLWHI